MPPKKDTTADHPKIHALIVAAGSGKRFGNNMPKQYTKIAGKTVLEHSVNQVAKSDYIDKVTLVIAANDDFIEDLVFSVPVAIVIGGAERWQSVQAGVSAIAQSGAEDDLIVIHDAARPCIKAAYIDKVIQVAGGERFGAILGTPVTDTIKQVAVDSMSHQNSINNKIDSKVASQSAEMENPTIIKTVERDLLWQAQTPQVFRLGKLQQVLDHVAMHRVMITDEASAFEILGYPIKIVSGDRLNIKLTYPSDLSLINAILMDD